jgi:hypothetical protein
MYAFIYKWEYKNTHCTNMSMPFTDGKPLFFFIKRKTSDESEFKILLNTSTYRSKILLLFLHVRAKQIAEPNDQNSRLPLTNKISWIDHVLVLDEISTIFSLQEKPTDLQSFATLSWYETWAKCLSGTHLFPQEIFCIEEFIRREYFSSPVWFRNHLVNLSDLFFFGTGSCIGISRRLLHNRGFGKMNLGTLWWLTSKPPYYFTPWSTQHGPSQVGQGQHANMLELLGLHYLSTR